MLGGPRDLAPCCLLHGLPQLSLVSPFFLGPELGGSWEFLFTRLLGIFSRQGGQSQGLSCCTASYSLWEPILGPLKNQGENLLLLKLLL